MIEAKIRFVLKLSASATFSRFPYDNAEPRAAVVGDNQQAVVLAGERMHTRSEHQECLRQRLYFEENCPLHELLCHEDV